MTSNWKTQKGDEWRYDSGSTQASGDLDAKEPAFYIRSIACSGGSLSEKQLLRLLEDTQTYFSEVRLLIKLHAHDSEVGRKLSSLQEKGLVGYRTSDSSRSQIEVTSVNGKKWWSL
jgi:hypothetical protein